MGTVEICSVEYEVYGTLEDANAYHHANLAAAAWAAATTTQREMALVTATRWIDRTTWQGTRTDVPPTQVLAWPRTGVVDCDGTAIDPSVVPPRVEQGAYELALLLLQDATIVLLPEAGGGSGRIREVHAGSVGVTFAVPPVPDPTRLPSLVHDLLRCFLDSPGIAGGAESFGTGEDSKFESEDELLMDEPL